jgi:hypothetical protein
VYEREVCGDRECVERERERERERESVCVCVFVRVLDNFFLGRGGGGSRIQGLVCCLG